MLVKDMIQIIGADVSTSNTKMPGTAFGISTESCNVGERLREVDGAICSRCYAVLIEKMRPNVRKSYGRRLQAIIGAIDNKDTSLWVAAMSERIAMLIIKKELDPYHRWHDSGDLLNTTHLVMLINVAYLLPDVNFWLPTKEKALIRRYKSAINCFPPNMAVRVSSAMIGGPPLEGVGLTCGTHRKGEEYFGMECPAYKQGNKCGDCRACWDTSVPHVSYRLHR